MTKAQTLAALKNQLDSFYSLQQVIAIIEGIAEPEVIVEKETKLTPAVAGQIAAEIEKVLEYNSSDLVDTDSAEFELDYDNKISLTGASIEVYRIMDHIEAVFTRFTDDNDE
jgi:hypothetical protein